ncbi:MAG: cellulose biosynthesis protein BcsS [Xanthobacteraceae bacterium]|uniref:cellulose biosynthesis protein BcsS n=1 Tax=Pseudolabrys sp. TaxID=1960880 RepID=UPI003D0A2C6A
MLLLRWAGVAAAAVTASMMLCGVTGGASAGSSRPGETLLLFSGTDLWRNGLFTHGGLLWSPDGLAREGFTFKMAVAGGAYRYTSGALGNATVLGREFKASVLPGWRFKFDRTEIKIFAGPEIQSHGTSPQDPGTSLRGTRAAFRMAFEFWHQPTPWTMLAADITASTISDNDYAVRLAAGWQMMENFYAGPEFQVWSDEDYRQYRLGLHLTRVVIKTEEWSLAAGWATDSDDRDGFYTRIGVLTKM